MRGQRYEFRNFFYEGNVGIYVKKAVEMVGAMNCAENKF